MCRKKRSADSVPLKTEIDDIIKNGKYGTLDVTVKEYVRLVR